MHKSRSQPRKPLSSKKGGTTNVSLAVSKPTVSKTVQNKGQKDLGDLVTDPLRWFRDDQLTKIVPRPLNRARAVEHEDQKLDEDEKLITIGGYIINLEKTVAGITTTIRPKISSISSGVEVEVSIAGVDPEMIRFEKRYNAILVIGVKCEPNSEDLTEVVNMFVPRDVSLARVSVTDPDSKGRIIITAP